MRPSWVLGFFVFLRCAAIISADVVLVASMGNQGEYRDNAWPAGFAGVIGVGGTNEDATAWWSSSSYGPAMDVAAPASDITVAIPPALCSNGCSYGVANGTSFAAPLVASAVALVRAKDYNADRDYDLNAAAVINRIVAEAKPRMYVDYPPGDSVKVLSAKCSVRPTSKGC